VIKDGYLAIGEARRVICLRKGDEGDEGYLSEGG
jgi:hypothetical protein